MTAIPAATSSPVLEPRTLTYRGRVLASGLLIDPSHLGESEARRRVVEAWRRGRSVYLVDDRYLVVFAVPHVVDTESIGGTVVHAITEGHVDVPLTKRETGAISAELAGQSHLALLTRGGTTRAFSLVGTQVDPGAWLGVDDFEWKSPASLAAPPPPPIERLPPVDLAENSVIRAGGEVNRQTAEVLERLNRAGGAASAAATDKPMAASSFWSRLFGPPKTGSSGSMSASVSPSTPPKPQTPRGPSLWERLVKRTQETAMYRELEQRAGTRQAQYLEKMFRMFEDGNLDEALRHAIGLGGEGGGSSSLRSPTARSSLGLSPFGGLGAWSFGGGPSLYSRLQALYRASFEKLAANGDVDKAAFVLLELLGEVDEAIRYLEKNGRFKAAAEIAEGRSQPPHVIASLWAQAGEMQRAILIARRHDAFAATVRLLELRTSSATAGFRLRWADIRAVGGDYEAAVQALGTESTQYRALAQKWAECGIAIGGAAGARLLAWRLSSTFEPSEVFFEVAHEVCDDRSEGAPRIRAAFAQALVDHEGPVLDAVANRLGRALLHDAAEGFPRPVADTFARLLKRCVGIRADAPASRNRPSTVRDRSECLVADVDLRDAGGAEVLDAATLPRGRLLVAYGAAGVHIVREQDGAVVGRFDVPAVAVVVSDHGDRALALSARSGIVQVWRLNLATKTTTLWTTVNLDVYASTYDGDRWPIAIGNEVLVLDALDDSARVLWRVDTTSTSLPAGNPIADDGFGGTAAGFPRDRVWTITRTPRRLVFVCGRPFESWEYDLPDLTLRFRPELSAVEASAEGIDAIEVSSRGTYVANRSLAGVDEGRVQMLFGKAGTPQIDVSLDMDAIPVGPCVFSMDGATVAVPTLDNAGASIRVFGFLTGTEVAHIRLEGARAPRVAAGDATSFLLFDDRGRVVRLHMNPKRLGPVLPLRGI